jgi:hypothetical protein
MATLIESTQELTYTFGTPDLLGPLNFPRKELVKADKSKSLKIHGVTLDGTLLFDEKVSAAVWAHSFHLHAWRNIHPFSVP